MIKLFIKYYVSVLFLSVVLFASCSNAEYRQAIPKESIALVSFDVSKISGVNNTTLLKALLRINSLDQSGIDLTQKIYLFVSPDGNMGICAKVQDTENLQKLFVKLNGNPTKYRDAFFSKVNDSWLAAYNDRSLLLMGPLPADAQEEMKGTMAKYLQQSEENSIMTSPIYQKLDSMNAPMAMVSQATALPEQFVAPMTLGVPRDATASQVFIVAEMNVEKGCWNIQGRPFSFNARINRTIEESFDVYRPITERYIRSMSADALLGMFVNVDGKEFLPLLQANKGLQVMMTGINQVIDLDNIIRSINGDMSVTVPNSSEGINRLAMAAQLAHSEWLDDIGYWKQSVPKGGRLEDAGKNTYYYADGKTKFCFGITDDLQFFSAGSREEAAGLFLKSSHQLPSYIQQQVIGEKLVVVVNLEGVDNETVKVFANLLKPVFGQLNTIVYKLK